MRPRAAAAAALAALLAVSGCAGLGTSGDAGPDGSPAKGTATVRPQRDEQQLRSLLARRARALQEGDVAAYAATAVGAQRTRDRRSARAAGGLPLRDVALRAERIEVHGRRAALRVRSGYAIPGVEGRFDAGRKVRAVRTDSGWRVRSETSRRRRHPWELTRFTERRTRHFVVLAPAGLDVGDAGLDGALEAGYGKIRAVLDNGRLRRRHLVVVAGTARDAVRLTEGIRGVRTLAAISDSSLREEGPARRVAKVISQRLVVVWPGFAGLGEEDRRRVVAHELTHAALAGATSGRTPAWLVEGIALYVSDDRRVDVAGDLLARLAATDASRPVTRAERRVLRLANLSAPDAIASLGGDAQAAAYAYSSSAAFHLADRYGRRGLLDVYNAFNAEDVEGRPGAALVDRAARRALGVGLRRLERDLRGWIPAHAAAGA